MKLSQDFKAGGSVILHSFIQQIFLCRALLSTLGEQSQVHALTKLAFQWGRADYKQINKYMQCQMLICVLEKNNKGYRGS